MVFVISVGSVISPHPGLNYLFVAAVWSFSSFSDFRRFRERRPACKPQVWQAIGLDIPDNFHDAATTRCRSVTQRTRLCGGIPQ